jgi:hypothetical protein
MSVRLLNGHGVHADSYAFEDFEVLPIGEANTLPQILGNGGIVLQVGHSIPRQGN